nr:excinuclease ABC subunit UvrC [Bacteroidales bacterium]
KQLQPRYNILLKDDKTYPWICIRKEPFPRVMLTRRYVQDGSQYFGPYASVQHARRLLDLMGNLYKLRICAHPLTPAQIASGKVRCCLNYHLEKCAGPCEGLFSEEEYNAQIEEIRKLLSGRTRQLMSECRDRMMAAAGELRFEEAQEWKDRLALLEAHHEREKAVGHGILDMETYKLLKEKTLPRRIEKSDKVVAQLQKDLGMNVPPRHIECFDNSNIQGTNPVAACVVFRDALPSKKDYRHFLIKTVVGANDYASMKEVVNRRYSRMMAEGEELPQLIVIDGGKGQLSFALEALMELGIADRIFMVGLAERMEEVIIPGDPLPLFLDKNSSSLRVLMHIRDEAHRFGITHHRNRRAKAQTVSALRSIPGVGEKTEQKLLRTFKSYKRVKEASLEELTAVVGPKLASLIRSTE